MADSENVIVEVQFDTNEMEHSLADLSGGISAIKTAIGNLDRSVSNGFAASMRLLQGIGAGVDNTEKQITASAKTLTSAISESTGAVAEQIKSVLSSVDEIKKQMGSMNMADYVSMASDTWNIWENIQKAFGGKGDNSKGTSQTQGSAGRQPWEDVFEDYQTALPPGKTSGQLALPGNTMTTLALPPAKGDSSGAGSGDISSVNGLVSGAMGDIAGQFSFDTGALTESIGTVSAKLEESTAAWVKNTAAKAASTAAEWAQIAATTAWQAICTAATAVTTAFGAAMSFLTSPIGLVVVAIAAVIAIAVLLVKNWDTVKAAAISVWEKIKETFAVIGDWIYTNVVSPVSNFLSGLWSGIVSGATAAWEGIKGAFMAVGNWFYTNVVSPVADFLTGLWTGFKDGASAAWEGVKSVFSTVWSWFKDTLLDPLVNGFKGAVNGVIGFINGLIRGAVDGINSIIGLLNKLKFDIPDWVPGLGGQTFGFNIGLVNAPQIPYLAKGAVLPANKPFLAMVGDQRHGTNVEAPLATIQEAVALVMNDQVAAMMAGFEATVAEVRQLRQLVSGIEIGDKTIGQAARRYERKMAVVTGGRY